jgi:putative acetyltransferase
MPISKNVSFSLVGDVAPQVDALLAAHHAAMRAASPEESCHVMTAAALRKDGASVFALRDVNGAICAVGALKLLPPSSAPDALGGQDPVVELKSMHVAAAHRGQGLGRVLLERMLIAAQSMGVGGACLETGTDDGFVAARGLYEAHGFTVCPPFGDYRYDPLSVFMCRVF